MPGSVASASKDDPHADSRRWRPARLATSRGDSKCRASVRWARRFRLAVNDSARRNTASTSFFQEAADLELRTEVARSCQDDESDGSSGIDGFRMDGSPDPKTSSIATDGCLRGRLGNYPKERRRGYTNAYSFCSPWSAVRWFSAEMRREVSEGPRGLYEVAGGRASPETQRVYYQSTTRNSRHKRFLFTTSQ